MLPLPAIPSWERQVGSNLSLLLHLGEAEQDLPQLNREWHLPLLPALPGDEQEQVVEVEVLPSR
jgi:hypothetical protein